MKKRPITAKELCIRYASGERDFHNIHCKNINLQDLDLREINLEASNLICAKFKDSNLQESSFINTQLDSASFQRAQLQESNFRGAYLQHTDFQGAKLSTADLSNTNLREARFTEADLKGANLFRADLRGAYFVGAQLQGVNLNQALCNETTYFPKGFDPAAVGAYVITSGGYLKGANLQDKNLEETNLEEANLEGANLENSSLKGANLQQANLQGANLQGANLQGANLQGANLQGANLRKAYLKKIEEAIEHVDYRLYRYAGGDIVNLQGADLRGAILPSIEMMEGANFQGAILQEVQLEDGKNLKAYLSADDCVSAIKTISNPNSESLNIENLLNPKNLQSAKRRVTTSIKQRIGQSQFRTSLLEAYDKRCAITECDAEEALEAAHIIPHSNNGISNNSNGILLRADLHILFDLYLLVIEPKQREILLAASLLNSSYRELEGKRLRLPQFERDYPAQAALEWRWKEFLKRKNK